MYYQETWVQVVEDWRLIRMVQYYDQLSIYIVLGLMHARHVACMHKYCMACMHECRVACMSGGLHAWMSRSGLDNLRYQETSQVIFNVNMLMLKHIMKF
jgi:hypothetical protein